MMYQGSAAYQIDVAREAWEVPARRSLSVMDGGNRAPRTYNETSPLVTLAIRFAVIFAVCFVVLGGARVVLTTATVSCLREVNAVESEVADAQLTHTELQVERSVLSSADRIQRIATENYGMVYATNVDSITVRDEFLNPASAEDAQEADVAGDAESIA